MVPGQRQNHLTHRHRNRDLIILRRQIKKQRVLGQLEKRNNLPSRPLILSPPVLRAIWPFRRKKIKNKRKKSTRTLAEFGSMNSTGGGCCWGSSYYRSLQLLLLFLLRVVILVSLLLGNRFSRRRHLSPPPSTPLFLLVLAGESATLSRDPSYQSQRI